MADQNSSTDPLGFGTAAPVSVSSNPNPLGFGAPVSTPQPNLVSTPAASDPLGFGGSTTAPPSLGGGVSASAQPDEDGNLPDEGILHKAWRVANTPLTEQFGIPSYRQGAGGFERGAEKILSGLTSPISLLLTAATLPIGGEGGLLESAGSNVLKETLMAGADGLDAAGAAAETGKFVNATKAALAARDASQPIGAAVEATGMNYNRYIALNTILKDASLDSTDLLGGNSIERGTSMVFRKLGVSPAQAQSVAKGLETALNVGFTAQQGYDALHTLPKVLDLWKEGDYDDANEALVEGLASGTLAAIGAHFAFGKAGELVGGVNEAEALRPTQQAQVVRSLGESRNGEIKSAQGEAKNIEDDLNDGFGKKTYFGNVITSAVKSLNDVLREPKAVAEARADMKRTAWAALDTGLDQDGLELARQKANFAYEIAGTPEKKIAYDPEKFGTATPPSLASVPGPEAAAQPAAGGAFVPQTPGAQTLEAGDGIHPRLPSDILDLVARAKDYPDTLKTQIAKFGDAYANLANGLDFDQTALVKKLQNVNWDTGTKAINAGVIGDLQENYVHRVFGEHYEKAAGHFINELRSGVFDLNADQALHRVFGTGFEGMLRGYPIQVEDPVQLAGHDIESLRTIAANQNFVDGLRANGVKGSDGRPVTILKGEGAALGSRNGGDPALLVKPNAIRNISISESEIQNMQHSGLLSRHLSNGDILDVTPRVRPDNIDKWIADRQSDISGLENQNHNHLNQPAARTALEQTHEFVTTHANDTANAVEDAFNNGKPLPKDGVFPKWLENVLKKDTPSKEESQRVQDYIDKRKNWAQGLNKTGDGPIKNGEISTLLREAGSRVPENLQEFWKDQGYQDGKGNWVSAESIPTEDNVPEHSFENLDSRHIKQVSDAASDTQYEQLKKDVQVMQGVKSGALDKTALDSINAAEPKQFVWKPQGYVTPAKKLTGAKWLAKTDDGTNVLVQGDIAFHPEFAPYLKNALGLDESPLRKQEGFGKFTSKALAVGHEAKAVLLGMSPFHAMQEGLRAIMLGVNPLKIHPVDSFSLDAISRLENAAQIARDALRDDPTNFEHIANVKNAQGNLEAAQHLRDIAGQGGTFTQSRKDVADHSEGLASHSKILSKIPILGKSLDWYQDFLFNRYMPSLKRDAAVRMYGEYEKAHPEWNPTAVAKATAEHVNNAFGGQDWRAMGRAAATQDWFSLFALAPDWLESEMRFAASTLRGGLGDKNFSRQQVALFSAGMWGVARALNLLNTGNMHLEAPFGIATKDQNGREVVYSMRTMPTDILHMASDPVGFMQGRMSPVTRLAQEASSGRDSFGRKLQPGDLWIDIARNMAPIPGQQLGAAISGNSSSTGNVGQIVKAFGGTSTVYRTEAEKLAGSLASNRDESGPMDEDKMRRSQAISRFEDQLRSGAMTKDQLDDAKDFGNLRPDEHKKIRENLKLTAGLDPETARMVSHVNNLDMPSALQVWDAATPAEKVGLSKIMLKKKTSYMKNALTKMTPQERMTDKTFVRVRKMFEPTESEQ